MKALRIAGNIARGLLALYCLLYLFAFRTTLPIEGVVVDAKTGEPVSKVWVRAGWGFRYSNLVDSTGGGFSYETVTDEQGRFRIPRKNVTVVFGSFGFVRLYLDHPLYDFGISTVYSEIEKKYLLGVVERGIVAVTVPFTSLRDRYSLPQDNARLADAIRTIQPAFLRTMKKKYGVEYDIKGIVSQLDQITRDYPGTNPENNYARREYERVASQFRELERSY